MAAMAPAANGLPFEPMGPFARCRVGFWWRHGPRRPTCWPGEGRRHRIRITKGEHLAGRSIVWGARGEMLPPGM